ncbi:MAG: GDP-mannose 4,6-dehydratase [Acidobacteriota bacterium]
MDQRPPEHGRPPLWRHQRVLRPRVQLGRLLRGARNFQWRRHELWGEPRHERRLGRRPWSRQCPYRRDVRRPGRGLQQESPKDYVIGTGETHTVQDFVEAAFGHLGLDWRNYVVIDPKLVRPAEVDLLISNPRRAREELGWTPRVSFRELVTMMVDADVAVTAREVAASPV